MLKDFATNEVLRNEVKTFLVDFLKEQTIKKAFAGESTAYIAEANDCIEGAFEHLEVLFAPKTEGKELKNEAR